MNTILLVHSTNALAAIPLAAQVARASHTSLILLCVDPDPVRSMEVVQAGQDENSSLVNETFEAVTRLGVTVAATYECRGPHLRRAVLNALAHLEVGQLILNDRFEARSPIRSKLIRQIARAAPFDMLLVDVGIAPRNPARVLVTQTGGGGEFGLQFAANVFGASGSEILVIPDPKSATRSARSL
jgi:hypothetical protein